MSSSYGDYTSRWGNRQEEVEEQVEPEVEDAFGISYDLGTVDEIDAPRSSNSGQHGVDREWLKVFHRRPRNQGYYGKVCGGSKGGYKKDKYIPWYQKNTPRGSARPINVHIDEKKKFEKDELLIDEQQAAMAMSLLKKPELYSERDLKNMAILISKFPSETEDDLWYVLNINGGELDTAYEYFKDKNGR
eukprot:TRINITY_DN7434_c0_g1_i3.p2 TRINITY_DN7434_c0_g1~~TRINITY_DN7434_c0_g1_i3.p2  ORF type:complete len:210 (-),score=28.77 TRINITY_DN7434_c0_g1_i3:628-1194(-)